MPKIWSLDQHQILLKDTFKRQDLIWMTAMDWFGHCFESKDVKKALKEHFEFD